MAAESVAGEAAALAVEIVWIRPDGSIGSLAVALPAGARVRDALAALRRDPAGEAPAEALARGELTMAIYGEHCDAAAALHPGDRIELLAALQVDPKLARRRRAEARRAQTSRGRERGGER
ncbi:MAG: RnfH family protein [Burkholderiaceae bacterium]|nr:RnfH family protein [Burkholderiaceae bacterium]